MDQGILCRQNVVAGDQTLLIKLLSPLILLRDALALGFVKRQEFFGAGARFVVGLSGPTERVKANMDTYIEALREAAGSGSEP